MPTDSFKKYLESISNQQIRTAVTSLYESTHGHKDRTTGGNWFGKTIRDQNNYDSKSGDYVDTREYRNGTKTTPETKRRYGNTTQGVKGMGMSGKFGSTWDLKSDGINSTGSNSAFSKVGRSRMKNQENRFFDPKKIISRDYDNELDISVDTPAEEVYNMRESWLDADSYYNDMERRKRDQLDNTVSVWKDKLSTSKYDYDDTMRDGFARLFADNMSDNPTFGSNKPGVWNAHFNNGLKLFDRNKEFVNSDEGRELQSSNFEYKYNHPETEPTSDDPKKMLSTDDEDVDKWIRAGYQSGDMFGEAIDKVAKVTGQKELCEAVKQIYKVCTESKK